jgi:DNA-binding PadR family transcriptional regulator
MRYALLALLTDDPAHGYELKRRFESRFGAVWPPVNIGQIYTTLKRLERDGLVHARKADATAKPTRHVFEITEAGYRALAEWFADTNPPPRVRDDLFIKLILAPTAGIADPAALIDRQRHALLQSLRDLNELAARPGQNGIGLLLVEGTALHIKADLTWLDMCEERLKNGS